MHSEDAVIAGALLALTLASCAPKGPSPSAALEGGRARRDRDAAATPNDDDEDALEDREALDAGISLRALSCKSDHECLTHRCDVDHERCRFPCRGDEDCQPGTRCSVDAGSLAACFKIR